MSTSNPKQPGSGRPPSDPPRNPTPEDPREHEPVRDPPIFPEHDDGEGEVRQAGGVEAPDPAPDAVIFDTNAR